MAILSLWKQLVLSIVCDSLKDKVTTEASAWKGASVLLTGTTPSIIDLRTVTLRQSTHQNRSHFSSLLDSLGSDTEIGTVHLSDRDCFDQLLCHTGLTSLFFESLAPISLVWMELPLFLFVILELLGRLQCVPGTTLSRTATSRMAFRSTPSSNSHWRDHYHGLVMAATFLSMTSSAWLPSVLDTLSISHNSSGRTLKGLLRICTGIRCAH